MFERIKKIGKSLNHFVNDGAAGEVQLMEQARQESKRPDELEFKEDKIIPLQTTLERCKRLEMSGGKEFDIALEELSRAYETIYSLWVNELEKIDNFQNLRTWVDEILRDAAVMLARHGRLKD